MIPLLFSLGVDLLPIQPMWQLTAAQSQLLGTSTVTLCSQEEKYLCFWITERISSDLVLMILLYDGNTKGICQSADNAAPTINYLRYYRFYFWDFLVYI